MAGFDVWKGRKSPQVQWFFCNKEGYNDSSSVDKQKEKGSVRIGCKGHVKVKLDPKEGCWYFDAIDLPQPPVASREANDTFHVFT
jgi:hypothetical protein